MTKASAFIFFFFALQYLLSCRSDRSKEELYSSTQLCNKKLFVETYIIFGGGAGGGDRVSEYLTDSSNFRIYIGTYVQTYKHYWYNCIGDSIQVHEMDEQNGNKIIGVRSYYLPELKNGKKFE
jgi:hypothetical protein